MEKIYQDIQYGLRTLWKSPGFTLTAVLSLGLAIGASTTVFSIFNSVLLRPLPYPQPERLVVVWETVRRQEVERRGASLPDYLDWRAENQSFEDIAAIKPLSFNLSGGGQPERIAGELVTASYFPVLGATAEVGRTFLPADESMDNPEKVAVISHHLWQSRFGASRDLSNQTIKLNEESFRVVGVMPESFQGTLDGGEVWLLLNNSLRDPVIGNGIENLRQRGVRGLATLARLKPNVTVEQAQREMDDISRQLERLYPDSNTNRGAMVIPLSEEWLGDSRETLWLFMVAVGCVLLIACVNVANLQLVRASNRQKEMAIRAALGASRSRLIVQMLTESVMLALVSGALALLLALWGMDFVVSLNPFTIPWFARLNLDARVFAFTFVVSILTGVLFGLFPALAASRLDLNQSLKEGRSTWKWRGRRFFRLRLRSLLIVLEISLAVVLLICAGLITKSFQQLFRVDLGFNPDNLLTLRVELPTRRYTEVEVVKFTNTLAERLKGLPQVLDSSLTSDIPLGDGSAATIISIEGRAPAAPGNDIRVYTHNVGPKYFETLGIKILRGQEFQTMDDVDAERVVIISDALARRLWPAEDALGHLLKEGANPDSKRPWYKIIGIAADAHHRGIREIQNDDPDIYFSLSQRPVYDLGLIARTRGGTDESTTDALRSVVQSIDPELPVYATLTMQQRIARLTAWFRTGAWLTSIFAVMALLLALIGTSGMMSYVVTLRTHEFGIRVAVGATDRDILKMVLGESLLLIIAGIALGLLAALAATRFLTVFLYRVSATDGGVFVGITLLLAGLSLLASYLPARRAMKMNPMSALRQE